MTSSMNAQRSQTLEAFRASRINSVASTESDREEMAIEAQEWKDLTDYAGALELNRDFVQGNRSGTFHRRGPPDFDMESHSADLLDLHDYGMLVHDFQLPLDDLTCHSERLWIDRCQRSYIAFLLPTGEHSIREGALQLFITLLRQHPHIVLQIIEGDRLRICTLQEALVLTKERDGLTVGEVCSEPWNICKWLSLEEQSVVHNLDIDILKSCLDIRVASKSWNGDVDVLKVVEGTAMASGIKRVYETSE